MYEGNIHQKNNAHLIAKKTYVKKTNFYTTKRRNNNKKKEEE